MRALVLVVFAAICFVVVLLLFRMQTPAPIESPPVAKSSPSPAPQLEPAQPVLDQPAVPALSPKVVTPPARRSDVPPSPASLDQKPRSEQFVPKDQWRDVGNRTPEAAFETYLWAIQNAEVDILAKLLFVVGKQKDFEPFFSKLDSETRAKFDTPEKIAALKLAGGPELVQFDGARMISRSAESMVFSVTFNEGTLRASYWLKMEPDGTWRAAFFPSQIDDIIHGKADSAPMFHSRAHTDKMRALYNMPPLPEKRPTSNGSR